jgi:hypothetical protein
MGIFNKLQEKWKISGWRFFLVLCTFALGGSLTGYLGKRLMNAFDISNPALYVLIYVLVVTLLWPLTVLAVSLPLGQFSFFLKYIGQLARKIIRK